MQQGKRIRTKTDYSIVNSIHKEFSLCFVYKIVCKLRRSSSMQCVCFLAGLGKRLRWSTSLCFFSFITGFWCVIVHTLGVTSCKRWLHANGGFMPGRILMELF